MGEKFQCGLPRLRAGVHTVLCGPFVAGPAPLGCRRPQPSPRDCLLFFLWGGVVCGHVVRCRNLPARGFTPQSHPGIPSSSLNPQGEENLQILVEPEGDSFPLMEMSPCETEASEQRDYVLGADLLTQTDPQKGQQQWHFLEELRRKGFHTKGKVLRWTRGTHAAPHPQMIKDQKQVFFGIRADNSIFDLYCTLLLEPKGPTRHAEQPEATSVPDTMSPPAQEVASKPGPPCPPDLLSPIQAPRGSARLVDQPRTFLVLATRQWMGIMSRELRVLGRSEGRQSGEVAQQSEGSRCGGCDPVACPE
ncbi:Anoctamin-9, partial [Plecturocebus cupreus]